MIDLRDSVLPDCLEVDGELFDINTDFRTWIRFGSALEKSGSAWYGVFRDKVPDGTGWVSQAVEFYADRSELPRESAGGGRGVRSVDFVKDGDYIVAAFQQAYGIDLTDPGCKMHWHRFMALFRGLPDDTMMSRIMGYRSWSPRRRKHDEVMRELRRAWEIRDEASESERERVLELFNERYG